MNAHVPHDPCELLDRWHVDRTTMNDDVYLALPPVLPFYTAKECQTASLALSVATNECEWKMQKGGLVTETRVGRVLIDPNVMGQEQPVLLGDELLTQIVGLQHPASASLIFSVAFALAAQDASRNNMAGTRYPLSDFVRLMGWDFSKRDRRQRAIYYMAQWLRLAGACCLEVRNLQVRPKRLSPHTWYQIVNVYKFSLDRDWCDGEVTIAPSIWMTTCRKSWYDKYLGNLHSLCMARRLGANPSSIATQWAIPLGLNILYAWRRYVGDKSTDLLSTAEGYKLSYAPTHRREWLRLFALTNPSLEVQLENGQPGKVRRYFDEALDMLKATGVIGEVELVDTVIADRLASKRCHWAKGWLFQKLRFTPTPDLMSKLLQIHRAGVAHRSSTTQLAGN